MKAGGTWGEIDGARKSPGELQNPGRVCLWRDGPASFNPDSPRSHPFSIRWNRRIKELGVALYTAFLRRSWFSAFAEQLQSVVLAVAVLAKRHKVFDQLVPKTLIGQMMDMQARFAAALSALSPIPI